MTSWRGGPGSTDGAEGDTAMAVGVNRGRTATSRDPATAANHPLPGPERHFHQPGFHRPISLVRLATGRTLPPGFGRVSFFHPFLQSATVGTAVSFTTPTLPPPFVPGRLVRFGALGPTALPGVLSMLFTRPPEQDPRQGGILLTQMREILLQSMIQRLGFGQRLLQLTTLQSQCAVRRAPPCTNESSQCAKPAHGPPPVHSGGSSRPVGRPAMNRLKAALPIPLQRPSHCLRKKP